MHTRDVYQEIYNILVNKFKELPDVVGDYEEAWTRERLQQIFEITFSKMDYLNSQYTPGQTLKLNEQVLDNSYGEGTATMAYNYATSITDSATISFTEGFKMGVTIKTGLKIPVCASVEQQFSFEINLSSTQSSTTTTTVNETFSATFQVPAHSKLDVILSLEQSDFYMDTVTYFNFSVKDKKAFDRWVSPYFYGQDLDQIFPNDTNVLEPLTGKIRGYAGIRFEAITVPTQERVTQEIK
jgi:hypothetical protein